MTRLDSVIRRLTAQRALLDWAARDVAERPGLVLELGLGNGRTYDHLRDRLPGRDIYAFERQLAAHPDCRPAGDRLILGDMVDTLPAFLDRVGPGSAVLVHADIGSGDAEANRVLAAGLSPLIEPLLAPGGLVLADRVLALPRCRDISAEAGAEAGRYYVYRR
ncbi:MAG TPA: class I SAM-dependent methyltransferase [Microvirga sp.]|jgi:hypothetical protein|nr:class I SAM-dependent methyltransferase [Microvirga sp.]